MAALRPFGIGKALILLAGESDPFSEGHTTGYLEFYDERHRTAEPITSQTICEHLQAIWNEPSVTPLWKAGRITGWIDALCENAPQTFRSFTPQERERMTVL